MHVEERWSTKELPGLIRREKSARPRDRMRAVLLAAQGRTAEQVAGAVGRSLASVKNWVAAWNAEGLDGLRSRPNRGAPPRLPAERLPEFLARIKAGPREGDGGVSAFILEDACRILQDEFGVAYTLSGAWRLLRRAGFSCLRPRPRHAKGDPEAQREWREETAPLLSRPSGMGTPAKTSRSGTRTRRASARRGR